jgi:hypothetical protein
MALESGPPIAGNDRALESDCADGGGQAVNERNYLAAAHIAQKLRDAGFACEIVGLDSAMLRLTLSKQA